MQTLKNKILAYLGCHIPKRLMTERRRRGIALLLCVNMVVSMVNLSLPAGAAEGAAGVVGPTVHIVDDSRVADPDTMDDYQNRLLTKDSGSRYAGRVWTDKTVFAYGYDNGSETDHFDGNHTITMNMATDGYAGSVDFDADFAHVFSVLASSQVVNEYPPSPVDLVIVFDMSGSMGQDTRFGIDTGVNAYVAHDSGKDVDEKGNRLVGDDAWPEQGVPMAERIQYSRIQTTLNAINNTIDALMEQNPQNRVAVCGYGANAVVLMPLAHYKHATNEVGEEVPYLSVGGMETLYHPSDLRYDSGSGQWMWMNNRDTCYTVVVNAQGNNYTGVLDEDGDGSDDTKATEDELWHSVEKTVSNNVLSGGKDELDGVKAFPGVPEQTEASLKDAGGKFGEKSVTVHDAGEATYTAGSQALINIMHDTQQLQADDYVGYFTNTQGGIYLAYKQLADTGATTYSEELSNGVMSTVARIPAAIIMSDGGANFAFNQMGQATDNPATTAEAWYSRYGRGKISPPTGNASDWYMTDQNWHNSDYYGDKDLANTVRWLDYAHRLGTGPEDKENVGDEWYNVYLPGAENLTGWKGLQGIYNVGADYYQDGTLTSQPYWLHAGVLYSNDTDVAGTPGTVLEVLLTAAYMNAVVKEHYETGWTADGATEDSQRQLTTYTMNVDSAHVPQWGRWRLYPTLDPKEYPLDDIVNLVNENPGKFGGSFGAAEWGGGQWDGIHDLVFGGVAREWKELKEGNASHKAQGTQDGPYIRMDPIPEGGYEYQAADGHSVTITQDEVLKNISYNEMFYDVTAADLDDIFNEILELILGNVFVPVSGDNDAGVGDSITYQDPIGEYMEIKNQSIVATPHHTSGESVTETPTTYDMSMLLFGEMHGLVRTGVYDYYWNDAWIVKNGYEQGEAAMKMGWYKGEATSATYGGYEEVPKAGDGTGGALFTDPADAWEDGWVYRVDYKTLTQYVPLVETPDRPGDLSAQAKNTVYTLYRFAGTAENRNALRRNPVYGEGIPQKYLDAWKTYYTNYGKYPDKIEDAGIDTKEYPGIYRLSDIRVWIEDTGDFTDTDGAIAPNTGYDRSLYLNVPAAAIPTELATITLGKDGVLSYETNLGGDHLQGSKIADEKGNEIEVDAAMYQNFCYQSTPLRLFYAVGLEEDLILRGSDGKQTGVDFTAISPEYISSHTVEGQDYIWFISNFYSNTPYTEYDTDTTGTRTRGDPTVTFSPGADNRYYVFQKPLPLYAHAYRVDGASLKAVDRTDNQIWTANQNQEGGNGNTTWETYKDTLQRPGSWAGGVYMGTYKDVTAFREAREKVGDDNLITDSTGIKYPVVPDGIVFLQQDMLQHVTSSGDGYAPGSVSFNSDDYFFILVEYYVPDGGIGINDKDETVPGTQAGHMVQYALARKGSEFGSAFASDSINNGDMLCWTDVNNNLNIEFDYLSRTDTGDNTRGEPTWEKLTTTDRGELEEYLRDCGITKEDVLTKQVEYWMGKQADPMVIAALAAADTDGDEDGKPSKKEFDDYFKFSVAARPGGIRSGDMSNNRLQKSPNTTTTSYSYYLPTISDHSGTGDNVIINNYLGNNGRLMIANQRLHVSKLLKAPDGYTLTNDQLGEEFNYQVFVQGVTGTRSAVQTLYNEYSGTWERRLAYIDVLTDNSDLLLTSSDTRAMFVLNEDSNTARQVVTGGDGKLYYADDNGDPTSEQCMGKSLYYLYLPSNGTGAEAGHTRRLYQDNAYEEQGRTEGYSMQAVFYDVLPDGWEYVDGSLKAIAVNEYNASQTFSNLEFDPIDEEGNIYAPLVLFKDYISGSENKELFNMFYGNPKSLTFQYTLKATDEWLAKHATGYDESTIHNEAAIKDKNTTHWTAEADITYVPAKLTKHGEQVGDSDLMRFTLEINPAAAKLDTKGYLVVKDTSEGLEIDLASIKVRDASGNEVDFEFLPAEEGQFRLKVNDGMALTVEYEARILTKGTDVTVSNSAEMEGVTEAISKCNGMLQVNRSYGKGSGESYKLTVEKTDSKDKDLGLAGAEFRYYIILKDGSKLGQTGTKEIGGTEYPVHTEDEWTFTTDEHGFYRITTGMDIGSYYILEETKAPDGYVKPDTPIVFYYGELTEGQTLEFGATAVPTNGTLTVGNTKDRPEDQPKEEPKEGPKTGSLTITKEVTGGSGVAEKEYSFTVTGPNSYSETVTLKAGESETLNGLTPGAYTVTEADANIEGWNWTVTGDGEVDVKAGKTAEVTVTNTYEENVGSLQISKQVVGGGETAGNKTYSFDVTGPNGYSTTVTVNGAGSVTLNNLVPGEYTVAEQDANIAGYTLAVTTSGSAKVEAGAKAEVTVTNTYTEIEGSLQITKNIVGGGDAAADKTYTFDITGPNGYSTTVEIKGAGTATLKDLAPGEYTITEQDANIEGYSLTVTGDTTATVTDDGNTAQATVINTYAPVTGSLTITKHVINGGVAAAVRTYTFVVTGPDGYSETVTINGAGTAILEDLIPGEYTVREQDASIAGWSWSVSGEGAVTVEAARNSALAITNTYDTPDNPPPPDTPDTPDTPNTPDTPETPDTPNTPNIPNTPNVPNTPPQVDIPNIPTPQTDIPDMTTPTTDIPDVQTPETDIPDEVTPMADIPDEELPMTEIPDETVPLDDVPQTGDKSKKGLWMLMAILSMLGMAFSFKKDNEVEDQ